MTDEQRTRYEGVTRNRAEVPGIKRVHSTACDRLAGGRCNCTPSYRAEAFDRVSERRAYKTFPTFDGANRWRQDKITAIRGGLRLSSARPTLKDAWTEWHRDAQAGVIKAKGGKRYKPGPLRQYEGSMRTQWLPAFGGARLDEIEQDHIQDHIHRLEANEAAPSTINGHVNALRVLFNWALRRRLVQVSPCVALEWETGERARDRVASVDEAMALIAATPTGDQAIWATAFFAGLRRAELMALESEQVDVKGRVIHVVRAFDPGVRESDSASRANKTILGFPAQGSGAYLLPKSKKGTRDVVIAEPLVPFLAQAKLSRPRGLLFGDGRPFHGGLLHERARTAWGRAELAPITLHSCRHTFASLLIKAGVDITLVSEMMGHAQVAITWDRYRHMLPGDLGEIRDTFDDYLRRAAGGNS